MSSYKHPDDNGPHIPSSVPDGAGLIFKLMGALFFIAVAAAILGVIGK